jgi:hypothetical protein
LTFPGNNESVSERLVNRSPEAGVDVLGRAGSVAMGDFSGNDRLDLMVSEWGYTDGQLRYFQQSDTGSFVERTREAGLGDIHHGLNLTQTDFDNDGDRDLFLMRGAWPRNQPGRQRNILLENTGNGRFVDRTKELGLDKKAPTQTAAWADVNRDGRVDVFVGNESSPGRSYRSSLYVNRRGKPFKNTAERAGLDLKAFVKGAAWGDVNDDGWPDLYVSIHGEHNRLYVNQGDTGGGVTFVERAREYGVEDPKSSFATGFFDFDNDGDDDLYVSTFRRKPPGPSGRMALNQLKPNTKTNAPVLYENSGEVYRDVSNKLGTAPIDFAMGVNFGDLNNDGYPDLLLGTGNPSLSALVPNRLLLNRRGRNFEDVTYQRGAGHLLKGHGVAFGDLDEDGRQEIYQVQGGGYPVDQGRNILLDGAGTDHNWIKINLVGVHSPRTGRGARIRITGKTPGGATRTIHHRVSTGFSFGSSPLRAEIGLGRIDHVDQLRVEWPSSPTEPQVLEDVPINRTVTINEKKGLSVQSDARS